MAFRKIRFASLELAIHANAHGAGISIAVGGHWWKKFAAWVRNRRAVPAAVASVNAPPPPHTSTPLSGSIESAPAQKQGFESEVESITWYHSIELAPGLVTRGQFDHGPLLPLYRLPESMKGQRVLDVATFDGYWAFEFERRGAREVVALDLDKPVQLDFPPKVLATATAADHEKKFGRGFEIAQTALNSKVKRVTCSVYDLTPQRYGLFDVVHAGDFLIHLHSPVRALQNIAAVCSGYALISDVFTPELDRPGTGLLMEYRGGAEDVSWWRFGIDTLEQMILDAGFARVERLAQFKYGPRGLPHHMHHVVFKAYK